MANKLINEQSPYLLQHAHNPVNWYPWGDEAFEIAEKENKPVIVSIGYAACHWCHVMERESFEDAATAAYMNEHFINIKVDREEHPDVDHLYMDAVQGITQQGGWPLNVFVTPQRVPFYGGTYFPPQPLYGRPSWMQLMQRMQEVWHHQPGEVETQATQMVGYLKQLSAVAFSNEGQWTKEDCRKMADTLLATADEEYGGFGGAPKFPAAMSVTFLLEHYHYTGYEPALHQALKSLDAMAEGGIYDQLAGGFARYSTDVRWLAPHFEKMLYDNALLIMAYTDAYAITRNEKYRHIVEETIAFVNCELRDPTGGFYCALDADSEGVEGKFYTWTWQEWLETTGGNKQAAQYFGVVEQGNWEHTNILHIAAPVADVASAHHATTEEVLQNIENVKTQLLQEREKRVRPATDDKCLLSWNAMMNLALSNAGRVLQRPDYIQQAQQHMHWMTGSFYHNKKTLFHTWKNSVAKIPAKLDDYALLINAMLQLASVSANNEWVLQAAGLIKNVQENFLHEDKSFFYFTSVQQQDIPVRKTELYDGSVPSSNSVMAHNLLLAGMLMERSDWVEQGQYMLRQMRGNAARYTGSFANWGIYGQRMLAGYKTAVVSGTGAGAMHSSLLAQYHPHACMMTGYDGEHDIPLLRDKQTNDPAIVHICDATSCLPPSYSIESASELLKNIL